MTKAAATRHALRRLTLMKCADAYSDALNGYARRQGAFTRGGVQLAVNRNLAASRGATSRQAPAPAPAPSASSAPSPAPKEVPHYSYRDVSVSAPKDYSGAKVLDALDAATSFPGRVAAWLGKKLGPRPVLGASSAVK